MLTRFPTRQLSSKSGCRRSSMSSVCAAWPSGSCHQRATMTHTTSNALDNAPAVTPTHQSAAKTTAVSVTGTPKCPASEDSNPPESPPTTPGGRSVPCAMTLAWANRRPNPSPTPTSKHTPSCLTKCSPNRPPQHACRRQTAGNQHCSRSHHGAMNTRPRPMRIPS